MGHYCRICARVRPNEKFSGKGHKTHVCKDCAKLPREEREVIELTEEIGGFLRQSNISRKYIARLRVLSQIQNEEVDGLAAVVLEVALMQSHRRRRLKMLARERPDLLERLKTTGLIFACL